MIFLLVNHNLSYTILGTYPPGPFRNNKNSPKKNSIFPAFPATLFQRGNFQHAKFFQRGKFAGKANCITNQICYDSANFSFIKWLPCVFKSIRSLQLLVVSSCLHLLMLFLLLLKIVYVELYSLIDSLVFRVTECIFSLFCCAVCLKLKCMVLTILQEVPRLSLE